MARSEDVQPLAHPEEVDPAPSCAAATGIGAQEMRKRGLILPFGRIISVARISTGAKRNSWLMDDDDSVVFLVDDDPSFRRSCERLLSIAGYRVESFPSAQEFLERGPPDIPACLVTDLRMPGMNGLDLQSELANAGC